MRLPKYLFIIAAIISVTCSHSKEAPYRFATGSDLTGYWSVMLLKRFDANSQVTNKQMLGNEPCNVHVIKDDGRYINVSSQVGDSSNSGKLVCAANREQIDKGMIPVIAMPASWSTWQAAGNRAPGVFFTKAPSDTRYLTWQVGYVMEDIENETSAKEYGFQLKREDLIFNLLEKSGTQNQSGKSEFRVVWFMVLRRIVE